jgi:pheromone shutdown-related protein TraB
MTHNETLQDGKGISASDSSSGGLSRGLSSGVGPKDEQHAQRLIHDEKEIILVGTAHISKESADLVERIIARENPDTVCVELCPARLEALQQKDRWQEMDIVRVIREKRASLLLFQLLLASIQKKMAQKFLVNPGEDMLRAIITAKTYHAEIVPVDRDIRISLLRTWRSMGFISKVKLLPEMLLSLFITEDITAEQVEQMKQHDTLELAMRALADKLPSIKTILIDERDQYLAYAIGKAPGPKIVAVIGAGHVKGVMENIGKDINITPLLTIPPASIWGGIIGWSVPLFIIGLFVAGLFLSGIRASMNMIMGWSAVTAAFSGLGALILLAHPLTIMASAFAAPFTTLHPLVAAGWVAGITEATIRKPKVADFLSLAEDITSIRGFFSNKITRILLLVAVVNLTTSIGTFVAIPVIMRFF